MLSAGISSADTSLDRLVAKLHCALVRLNSVFGSNKAQA